MPRLRPYPGLDPELEETVARIDALFPDDDHLLPVDEYRALLEAMSEGCVTKHALGMVVHDAAISVQGRSVALRIYQPRGWQPGQAVILYAHGGGWMLGSIDGHDQITSDLAQETGLAVVSIDYALAPEHPYPAALEDCVAAFEWLRSGLSPVGGPGPIWVAGDSAGGNLALATSLWLRDRGMALPAGQALVYPCTGPDFTRRSYLRHADAPFLSALAMRRYWEVYLGGLAPDLYAAPALAPELSGLPPAIILTVALDPLADEGAALAEDLRQVNGLIEHREWPTLIHGFLRFRDASKTARSAFSWLCRSIRAAAV